MRDRKVMAVYVLGTLSVVGGIVLYNHLADDTPDGQGGNGTEERVEAGEGLLIDLALPEPFTEREPPAESRPVSRAITPPATHSSRSAAGGSASSPAARPALVSTPACAPSLLGSVIGLLGALLGGGGGC